MKIHDETGCIPRQGERRPSNPWIEGAIGLKPTP